MNRVPNVLYHATALNALFHCDACPVQTRDILATGDSRFTNGGEALHASCTHPRFSIGSPPLCKTNEKTDNRHDSEAKAQVVFITIAIVGQLTSISDGKD